MAKNKENQRKDLHLHRIHPIILGGNPADRQNITFVTRLEHAALVVFWNRKIAEMKNNNNETTA